MGKLLTNRNLNAYMKIWLYTIMLLISTEVVFGQVVQERRRLGER